MKSRTSICITAVFPVAVTLLALLMVSTQLAAQEQPKSHLRYKLVVIGTFGGPSSFSFFGQARSLNNPGTLVGWANTSTPDPNFPNFNPLFGQADPFIEHGFRWRKDELTDLGALPGVNSSQVSWVNDAGVAVGGSTTGHLDPITGFPAVNAVVWVGDNIFNLGTFEGGYESLATGINNREQITGIFSNSTPDPNSLFGLGTQTRSFLWQNGSMQDIGTLGGPDAAAMLINVQGQIAGISYDSSFDVIPFLWQKGKMVGLGSLGGTFGSAGWLNNRGQVVGQSNLPGDTTAHPFIWTKGENMKDLGTLGGTFGFANWINESGEVVGAATNQGDQALLAFLWKDGVMVSLGTVDGDPCSQAISINSRGQVVGSSVSSATDCFHDVGRAFLWEHGGPMLDLNTFVPAGLGLTLTQGAYINDRGEILATGALPDGDTRAVLLIPCDAEHSDIEDCQDESAGAGVVRQSPAPRSVFGATPHMPTRQRIGRFPIPQNVARPRN